MNNAFDLLDGRRLVVAPMGGGPSTPSLVVAAGEAGAFAFVAGAYKTADELADEIRDVQRRGRSPFGVNVFVPGQPTGEHEAVARYASELQSEADRLGVEVGHPRWDDDN